MDLKNALKGVEVPVVIKLDDDSLKNLFIGVFFVGTALMVVSLIITRVK